MVNYVDSIITPIESISALDRISALIVPSVSVVGIRKTLVTIKR